MTMALERLTSSTGKFQLRMSMFSLTLVVSVEELAKKKGISMAQVSTAWALSKEGVPIIHLP